MTVALAPDRATAPTERDARPQRAATGLYARLVRRSTVLLAAAMAAYVAMEIASYNSAYPNGVSPVQFELFADNPAVRMMNGIPYGLDSAGGFAYWDAGWLWELLLGIWALLVTTRFLRGEEDGDRADLLLSMPVRASRLTGLVVFVVMAAGAVIALATTASLLAFGQDLIGSLLLGIGLAGFTALFAASAAVVSQLVEVRRRAAAFTAALLGLAYVLRMIGNSSDSWAWVRWTTPFGWMEELQVYGDPQPIALVPLLVVPGVLAWLAVLLRSRRDTGGALLSGDPDRPPRTRMLGSPMAFAWRSNQAVLLGWVIGLALYSAVMGALVTTMIDWISGDEGYQRIMSQMGLDEALTIKGFIAMIGIIMGLGVALQVSWRIGAVRAEEESGRLEAVLARPVGRLRWLGGHVLLAGLAAILLLALIGWAMWFGALLAGSDDITAPDTIRALVNTLPVVLLIGGVAVLTFGLLPRLTVAVPVSLSMIGLVLYMLGPALQWPQWVLNLSPFTHLALVPAEPWAWVAGLVMALIGVVLCGLGLLAFQRRDLATG
jgi:ABC-2 type transport system permease protein